MYLFFVLLIPILILLLIIGHRHKKKIIHRVRCMCAEDKCILLNELSEPLGYYYIAGQDAFTTRIDALQRDFGYGILYDNMAVRLNMVFDSLPVYFNYHDRTWLLELWKGQYGINTGCEIGLYYADRILLPGERSSTIFQSVSDEDMIRMSFTLSKNGESIARLNRHHWWLAAFHAGCFSQPADLSMRVSLTFPTTEMACCFTEALFTTGISPDNVYRRCCTVSFCFDHGFEQPGCLRRLRIRLAQLLNRLSCKLYWFITRPFHCTPDKILYLYYYLPFALRRMLCIRKHKRPKKRKRSLP